LRCWSTFRRLKRALKELIVGATVYDMAKTWADMIRYNTYAIMSVLFADTVGIPLPCYYRLRLLPLLMPQLNTWRRFVLKEKDITEKMRE